MPTRRRPVARPRARARVKKALKRVGNGRYQFGGKFVSAVRAKQIRAARTRAAVARRTTGMRRVARPAARRAPARVSANPKRKLSGAALAAHEKKKMAAVRRRQMLAFPGGKRHLSAVRSAAAKKAAATRKRKKAARVAAGKKGARKRKRTTTTTAKKARKRAAPKRRKTVARKAKKRSTASYRKAALKGVRTKKARGGRKRPASKRRKPTTRRRKRASYKGTRVRTVALKTRRGARRKARRYIRSYAGSRGGITHRITKNPMTAMKNTIKRAVPIYGGMVLVRVASALIDKQLKKSDTFKTETMAKVLPYLPAGLAFVGSLFAGKLIKGKPRWVEGIQLGAAFTLFDVVMRQLVKPALLDSTNETIKLIGGAMAGYDDMGFGAYIANPSGYSLPVSHVGPIGLDVEEAMAIGEYVPEGMAGFNVEEALAADELAYLQHGGAGGSLSRTVFST